MFTRVGVYEISFKIENFEKKMNITIFDKLPNSNLFFTNSNTSNNKRLYDSDINIAIPDQNYNFYTAFNFTSFGMIPIWRFRYNTSSNDTFYGNYINYKFDENQYYELNLQIDGINRTSNYYIISFTKIIDFNVFITPSNVVKVNDHVQIFTDIDPNAFFNCALCEQIVYTGMDEGECKRRLNSDFLYCEFTRIGNAIAICCLMKTRFPRKVVAAFSSSAYLRASPRPQVSARSTRPSTIRSPR